MLDEKLSEVPLSIWITGGLIYLGSLFQVGYFHLIGINFISTVGITDWGFSLLVMAGPIVAFAFFIELAAKGMARTMLKVQEFGWLVSFFDRLPQWYIGLSGLFIAICLRLTLLSSPLLWTAFYTLLALGFSALVIMAAEEDGWVPDVSTIIWLAIFWGLVSYSVGGFYAGWSGKPCVFTFNDGRQLRAIYQRSVESGHIVLLNRATYLLDKSSVNEIKCPWAEGSAQEWKQLAVPDGGQDKGDGFK